MTPSMTMGEIGIVQDALSKHVPEAEVRVFGSRATGKIKSYSDLDLALDTGRPLTFSEIGNLTYEFQESDLPYRVDVVDYHSVGDNFKNIIDTESIPLNENDSGKELG